MTESRRELTEEERTHMGGVMDDRFGTSHVAVYLETEFEAGYLAAREFDAERVVPRDRFPLVDSLAEEAYQDGLAERRQAERVVPVSSGAWEALRKVAEDFEFDEGTNLAACEMRDCAQEALDARPVVEASGEREGSSGLVQRLYEERNRNCEIAVGLAERIHHERDDYGAYVRAMDELVGDDDAEVDAYLAASTRVGASGERGAFDAWLAGHPHAVPSAHGEACWLAGYRASGVEDVKACDLRAGDRIAVRVDQVLGIKGGLVTLVGVEGPTSLSWDLAVTRVRDRATPLAASTRVPDGAARGGERLYNALALFDTRDGSALGHIVRSAREGWERSDPDMDEEGAWEEFDARIGKYEAAADGHDCRGWERDHDGVAVCPVCGRHPGDDLEDRDDVPADFRAEMRLALDEAWAAASRVPSAPEQVERAAAVLRRLSVASVGAHGDGYGVYFYDANNDEIESHGGFDAPEAASMARWHIRARAVLNVVSGPPEGPWAVSAWGTPPSGPPESDERDVRMPADLVAVLKDPGIIVRQDAAVFELIAKWQKAQCPTESAGPPTKEER